ncbi:flavonol synthase [Colletotrichum tofieldiae]|nr:flavonol synthase [Colletotrichum tofieldiae]
MPSAVSQLYQYTHVPRRRRTLIGPTVRLRRKRETTSLLGGLEVPTIDLANYGTPEGNKELAQTLIEAIRTKGFFYVINYGISQEAVDTQFSLGQKFYELPLEEKLKYEPDLDSGDYNGYRPAGRRFLSGGIKDKTEVWNMATKAGHITQPLPKLLDDRKQEIEGLPRYLEHRYRRILVASALTSSPGLARQGAGPLNHLIALALELPEDFFTRVHKWETHDESHLRYMKYSKFTPEEIEKLDDGLWSRGHTDLGTITLLFRQPVAALQIRDHETGSWKWAKPLDGSLTVNTCDALSFLTGGYVKSTVHRVSVPPKDQRHVDRLGLLYFARPQNDLPLKTIDSPVLKREGFTQNEFEAGGHRVPTMGEFTTLKQTWQQKKGVSYQSSEGQEILPGFKGQYFQ